MSMSLPKRRAFADCRPRFGIGFHLMLIDFD